MNEVKANTLPSGQDLEHLRLLSVFHYVVGGITALFSCMFLLHLGMGIVMIVAPEKFADRKGAELPPPFFGWVFAVLGACAVTFGWGIAACLVVAGRFLARRRHYLFCLVIAALACLIMPFGTVLGVFTIIVLMRPSVKAMFI